MLTSTDWHELLKTINTKTLFGTAPVFEMAQVLLCAPVTLAQQFSCFSQETIQKILNKPIDEECNIYIAGAEFFECVNHGDNYRVLPLLIPELNASRVINIHLIGPGTKSSSVGTKHIIDPRIGTNVHIHLSACNLGEYIKESGLPDLLSLNHPGFEATGIDYFGTDTGLELCLNSGIPIVGCSYSDDEAEIDQIELRALGFDITEITDNPLVINTGMDMQMADQAGQIWMMKMGLGQPDLELAELLRIRHCVFNDRMEHFNDPVVAFSEIYSLRDGKQYYWLFPDLHYCMTDHCILEKDSVVLTDIELDATYLSKSRGTPLQASLISAAIRRDYIYQK